MNSDSATDSQTTPEDVQPSEPPIGTAQEVEPTSPPDARKAKLDGDDLPAWARGRTPEEIIAQAEEMRRNMEAYVTSTETPKAQTPAPTPQDDGLGVDPDLLYSDSKAYTQQLMKANEARTRQAIEQASAPLLKSLALTARREARSSHEEIFELYGAEIDAYMTALPLQSRADAANWKKAASLVAGEHLDEIAQRRAERLAASARDSGTMSTQATPASAGKPSSRDPIDQLFIDKHPGIQRYLDVGLTATDVKAQADRMGKSHAHYAKLIRGEA